MRYSSEPYEPLPRAYENEILFYDWGDWEEPMEFLLMVREEDEDV